MTLLRFDPEFPQEIGPAVREIVDRHLSIVPDWCDHVTVYFSSTRGNNGDLDCEAVVEYGYRFAQVYICAGWLLSRDRERELVHELFHIVTAPAATTGRAALLHLLKDCSEAHRETVMESFRQSVESQTEDLTILYLAGRLSLQPTG